MGPTYTLARLDRYDTTATTTDATRFVVISYRVKANTEAWPVYTPATTPATTEDPKTRAKRLNRISTRLGWVDRHTFRARELVLREARLRNPVKAIPIFLRY